MEWTPFRCMTEVGMGVLLVGGPGVGSVRLWIERGMLDVGEERASVIEIWEVPRADFVGV
ncbi:MAG: hypothetical protein R3B68_10385 [Phycisphaerales bacterium]